MKRTNRSKWLAPLALLTLLAILFIAGCSSMGGSFKDREMTGYPADYMAKSADVNEEYAARSAPAPMQAPMAAAPTATASGSGQVRDSAAQTTPGEQENGSSGEPETRKRVYSGYAELVVESVDKTKQTISETALAAGGYIEGISERFIVIRVPVERFQEIFAEILLLGTVRRQSVETVDVTEAFTDLSTRLSIAQKTRERLYALLQKTDSVEERLRILREIRRLTEEIERVGATLATLEKSIAFSRIQVSLTPRVQEEPVRREAIPFPWIADLDPLYPSMWELKPKATITLPDDFAVFTDYPYFMAESADGVRVRISSTANHPEGDAPFWRKALLYHMGPFYRNAEGIEGGEGDAGFLGAVFTSKDREPYTYLVALWVRDKSIIVLETFFPNGASKEAHYEEIVNALTTMETGK